jgi:asparagine synthase (glutamine-hydrolysing)
MCGIFGVIYRDGTKTPDGELLNSSARLLGHRGPDNTGVFRAPGLGLVHTRLSLLDLSERGNQPFWDEQRRHALVYNGEVYNFLELRRELESAGVAFSTGSDTEVVLKGIVHHGLDRVLPRLEGMFAFAFWDNERRCLTLVRDRLGIKPLSVYEDEEMLVFSSEVKAMKPWIPLEPDPHMASAYLSGFGGATRDRSFFDRVRILAPGTVVEIRAGQRATERSFFHIADFWDPEEYRRARGRGDKAVVDRFEELLFNSVRKHLLADAPVGAFCSGGLDSSLVMAMASKLHSNLAIFHANVTGPLSEYESAKALAQHLRLDMKVVDVTDHDFVEQMPAVIWHYEYPFGYHPNSVPFLAVSKLVRANGVKAILSGEGSDECFMGYAPIVYEDLRHAYRRFLAAARTLVHRVPKLGRALWPKDTDLGPQVHELEQNFERALDRVQVRDRIDRAGLPVRPREYRSLEWLGYHLRTLLHRNDALGMAASIEARFPYLDHDLVGAAVNLPYHYKVRPAMSFHNRSHPFLRDKWVVRMVADRFIPRALSQRKKIGFPTNAYARLECSGSFYANGFLADFYRLGGREVEHLLAASDQEFGVRLLMLEVWGQLFFRGATEAELVARLQRHARVRPAVGSGPA